VLRITTVSENDAELCRCEEGTNKETSLKAFPAKQSVTVANPESLKRREATYQRHRTRSQMHKMNETRFMREKGKFKKKFYANMGGGHWSVTAPT